MALLKHERNAEIELKMHKCFSCNCMAPGESQTAGPVFLSRQHGEKKRVDSDLRTRYGSAEFPAIDSVNEHATL